MKCSERNINLNKILLNMKRIYLIFVMLLVVCGLFTMQSCKKDTATPYKEFGAFTIPTLVAPASGGFLTVTGTTVDLKWESSDADGDAQKWDVYFGTGEDPARVQTAYAQQTLTVTVEKGLKYYWRVVGTDSHGIITRSPVWNFDVVDPDAILKLKMTWTTNALEAVGMDLDPLLAANLRLLIRKADKTSQATVNTTGFEEYSNWNTLADGKYYIATDISTTIDAGDFNSPISISIDLAFSQKGVQNQVVSLPDVLSNKFACSTYRVYLGFLEKVGSVYTFTKEVTYPVSAYSGVWYGLDKADADYDSEVETYQGCSLQIKGLVNGWMSQFWGEVIVKGGSASITIDAATGVVTIPLQYYCTTKYNGVVQPVYNIEGTGTYDATGAYPKMTIQYTLIQGSDDWAQWMFDNGYMATNKFEAELTLDPAGLKGAKSVVISKPLLAKPVR
jgi:hypothetical protein